MRDVKRKRFVVLRVNTMSFKLTLCNV